jgi:(2R)-ethylmalonyl-CoA mutase
VSKKLGRRLKFLVGKPGLDGHSNGAEQIAVRARDAGMDVVYDGIRLTPEEIVEAAAEKNVHVVGCRSCPARICRWWPTWWRG